MLRGALSNHKNTEIIYLSSPNYSITVTSKDYKEANKEMDAIIEEMSNIAKANGIKLEVQK